MLALHVVLLWPTQSAPPAPVEPYPEALVERFEDTARDEPTTALPWLKQLSEKMPQLAPADQKKLVQVYEKTLARTREKDTLDLAIAMLSELEKAGDTGAAATLRLLKRPSVDDSPTLLAEVLK